MALKVEGIVYGGVDGQESLGRPRVLETDPIQSASSNRFMCVLGTIV